MTDIADLAGGTPLLNGDLSFGSLVAAAADDVVRPQTESELKNEYGPTDGRIAIITDTDEVFIGDGSNWQDADHNVPLLVSGLPGVTVVSSTDDLPDASGGVRTLENGQSYLFTDFVSDPATLRLGDPSPLLGWHGGQCGYIHTGGGTCLKADGEPYFARNAYFHAPGGTIFDLTGDTSTEMLVESCAYSDAAGINTIASLGTIDGYRVPTFKGCNFEDFDDGITLTNSAEKVFLSECPFRSVSASNCDILTLDTNSDIDIVDITDCYVKGVQSDTRVIVVENGADPTEIFQYRGVTHDNSVTESNILNGTASVGKVGYRVRDSYPLPDSEARGELDLDASVTVTGSGTSATEIGGSHTILNEERVQKTNGNRLEYIGKKDVKAIVHAVASVSGANTDFSLFIGKNGTALDRTESTSFNPNASTPAGVTSVTTLTLKTNDTVSTFLENTGGDTDLTVEKLALTV